MPVYDKQDSSWTDAGRGRMRKTATQAQIQAKAVTQARAIGTVGEEARAKEKTGLASPQE